MPQERQPSHSRLGIITKSITERAIERGLFLTQAQTNYWRFCSSCRKLHPRSEFEKKALNEDGEKRHCKWPGIVIFSSEILRLDLISNILNDIDCHLPWTHERYLPEFGLDYTPCMKIRL